MQPKGSSLVSGLALQYLDRLCRCAALHPSCLEVADVKTPTDHCMPAIRLSYRVCLIADLPGFVINTDRQGMCNWNRAPLHISVNAQGQRPDMSVPPYPFALCRLVVLSDLPFRRGYTCSCRPAPSHDVAFNYDSHNSKFEPVLL